MNILLDTHALIWFFEGSSKLSEKAKLEIQNHNNTIFVSVVSFWEIAKDKHRQIRDGFVDGGITKTHLGKWNLNYAYKNRTYLFIEKVSLSS